MPLRILRCTTRRCGFEAAATDFRNTAMSTYSLSWLLVLCIEPQMGGTVTVRSIFLCLNGLCMGVGSSVFSAVKDALPHSATYLGVCECCRRMCKRRRYSCSWRGRRLSSTSRRTTVRSPNTVFPPEMVQALKLASLRLLEIREEAILTVVRIEGVASPIRSWLLNGIIEMGLQVIVLGIMEASSKFKHPDIFYAHAH